MPATRLWGLTVLRSTVDPPTGRDKGGNRADWPRPRRFQLNERVPDPTTTYRLAPALGARLVGRSLVALAVLVVVATLVGAVIGAGWVLAGVVALIGVVLVGGRTWYLLRRAWAVRLSPQGYDVRLLAGVGVASATWTQVGEVVAASPGGRPCLVLRLRDGRMTRLPMTALAGSPDDLAHDVRRRVRDAHTPD